MSRNDDYCSELVAVAYRNIGRTVNIGNKFSTDATPGDLASLVPAGKAAAVGCVYDSHHNPLTTGVVHQVRL